MFPLTPPGMAQAVLEGWGNPKAVDLSHSNANFLFFPPLFSFFQLLDMTPSAFLREQGLCPRPLRAKDT